MPGIRGSEAGVRQQQAKLFYVSPVIGMAMRYHFRVSLPGERLKLRILETDRRRWLMGARLMSRPHAAGANTAFDSHYQLGDRQTRRL
jgi:uncharacterized protein